MATFTMRLHSVLDLTQDIGLNDFEIFSELHRPVLTQKFKDRFMHQEIAHETIDQFRFAVRRKFNEIMPYYNQLYVSTQLKFDPLNTIDISSLSNVSGKASTTSESTSKASETSKSTSDSTAESAVVNSSFPATRLAGNKDYASNGQDNASKSQASSDSAGQNATESEDQNNTVQDGTTDSSTKGFQGNRSALLMDYRATFLNVDMQIMAECEELFMSVWGSSDSYTGRSFYPVVGYGYW